MLTRARLWVASVLRRRQFDRDLADEVTFHIETRAEHLQREGMSSANAKRQARLEFGALDKYKDEVREVRTGIWPPKVSSGGHRERRRSDPASDGQYITH